MRIETPKTNGQRLACRLLVAWLACGGAIAVQAAAPEAAIDFNRDVRPILSDKCWRCHGPDEKNRKADLRLDTEDGAMGATSADGKAIIRGKPDDSEFWRRIVSTDPDEQMPPKNSGVRLTPEQIVTLRRWLEQGSPWAKHWSFTTLRRPPTPALSVSAASPPAAPRSAIDLFVRQRLTQEKLSPSVEASRETLIRRATFDLTGLPPTLEEIDSFLADNRPDAYERLIDRLLASPRYGERMGIRWLETARYADTSGYQSDGPRYMWRWRDWVIEALNHDLPFDQFTIEQLAGDLLPNATPDQIVATGFNRNHRGNSEGGIIPEEFAVEYVVDRVETTCTTWLGLTMGCVRCHDHKFDPLTQRDFYSLYAYFNSIPEFGRAIKEGNSPPYIPAPTRFESESLTRRRHDLLAAERAWKSLEPKFVAAREKWEREIGTQQLEKLEGKAFATWSLGSNDQAAQRVPLPNDRFVTNHNEPFSAGDIGAFGYFDKFSLAARVLPRGDGTIVSRMSELPEGDGYYLRRVKGKLQVNLIKRWLDDAIRVETVEPIPDGRRQHLLVTYDGSRHAAGVRVYVDGRAVALHAQLDALNQSFANKEPFRVGGGGGDTMNFAGEIEDVWVFSRPLSSEEALALSSPNSPMAIARTPHEKRSAADVAKLRAAYLALIAPAEIHDAHHRWQQARRELAALEESISNVMVMQELPQPREAFILTRGEYDKPGEKVSRNVPTSLPPLPNNAAPNRLGLARWLVSPDHPLTARVTVNRAWQQFFPVGLVKTSEDFGSQGEAPSHPELLDWLAANFSGAGSAARPAHAWSLKHLHREIATSGTYRQSSKAPAALAQRDPENRLLARGPRFRLSAEMIRDQALAVSGLLVERLGGPSIKPYQPADFWKDLANDSQYTQSQGADLYRRGMYTFWRRTVSPPTLVTFDAANRDTCIVRPVRTNTPLQALTLMNETTFVEAARVLAERLLALPANTPADRVRMAFRLVTSRSPSDAELAILVAGWERNVSHFRSHPADAAALLTTGDKPAASQFPASDLAAYTALASVLLNLDEAVARD